MKNNLEQTVEMLKLVKIKLEISDGNLDTDDFLKDIDKALLSLENHQNSKGGEKTEKKSFMKVLAFIRLFMDIDDLN